MILIIQNHLAEDQTQSLGKYFILNFKLFQLNYVQYNHSCYTNSTVAEASFCDKHQTTTF